MAAVLVLGGGHAGFLLELAREERHARVAEPIGDFGQGDVAVGEQFLSFFDSCRNVVFFDCAPFGGREDAADCLVVLTERFLDAVRQVHGAWFVGVYVAQHFELYGFDRACFGTDYAFEAERSESFVEPRKLLVGKLGALDFGVAQSGANNLQPLRRQHPLQCLDAIPANHIPNLNPHNDKISKVITQYSCKVMF